MIAQIEFDTIKGKFKGIICKVFLKVLWFILSNQTN